VQRLLDGVVDYLPTPLEMYVLRSASPLD